MVMPKTSVHEDNRRVFREDHIRLARQVVPMQPKSKAHSKETPAHFQFKLCVLGSNGRHHTTSDFFTYFGHLINS